MTRTAASLLLFTSSTGANEMRKRKTLLRLKTHFEQIPIVLVKKIANEALATKRNETPARAEALLIHTAKNDGRVGLLRQQGKRA